MKVYKGILQGRHSSGGQTKGGGNALKSEHSVTRDRKGSGGFLHGRTMSTKPSSSSGTIGHAQPLKMNSGGKEQRGSDSPRGSNTYKSTKPKR